MTASTVIPTAAKICLQMPPRDAEGRCQPAGKMSAAADVLVAAVFDVGRIVRMTRPWDISDIIVVATAGVGVADDGGKRRAAGHITHQSA